MKYKVTVETFVEAESAAHAEAMVTDLITSEWSNDTLVTEAEKVPEVVK
jgi:hypothetical protein